MPQVADFDHNLFDPRNPYLGDEKVPVQFRMDAFKNDAETEKQGRPIYDETEFIRIIVSKDQIVDRPVRDSDKQRWPRQYAAWKNTGANEPGMMGTPLSAFPLIDRAQVETLRYFKVYTIEQLAELPDATAQGIPGIQKLKQQAAAHLMIAKEQAPFVRMNEELQSRDATIAEQGTQIAMLQSQLTELLSRMPAQAPQPQTEARRR